jgi:cytochrome o ubiquinol oxidase operon protein cyoD
MSAHTEPQTSHGSVASYVVGFALSIALTLGAYFSVTHHLFSHIGLIAVIFVLAMVQLVVQLLFFLHLGREGKPRFNLLTFLFMLLVLLIIVIGSLWIMNNLNYHSMTPNEVIKDEGVHL